ncbi:MAG: hypothetical protein DRG37_04545 [Deltaproteobacteria bacterium]|nr:MAG: hypothetical protein DRG37_04545 [Deltaproteobacteria bacterium]
MLICCFYHRKIRGTALVIHLCPVLYGFPEHAQGSSLLVTYQDACMDECLGMPLIFLPVEIKENICGGR